MFRKFGKLEIALLSLTILWAIPLGVWDHLPGWIARLRAGRFMRWAKRALMLSGGYAVLVVTGLAKLPV